MRVAGADGLGADELKVSVSLRLRRVPPQIPQIRGVAFRRFWVGLYRRDDPAYHPATMTQGEADRIDVAPEYVVEALVAYRPDDNN